MATNGEYLVRVPLFAGLSRDLLSKLADCCSRKALAKGDLLFSEGDEGDCLYVILSGYLRVERLTREGSSHTLAVRRPGEIMGEMALIDAVRRSAQVVAQTRSKLLVLHRREFQQHLLKEPAACLGIMQTLAARLRELSEELIAERSLEAHERLLGYLQKNADEEGYCRLTVSQTQLAELLGCTRETINRGFSELKNRGQIEKTGRLIKLTRSNG